MNEPNHNIKKASATKIICTLGPSTSSVPAIAQLFSAGMRIARINLSHGSYEARKAVIANIKLVRKRYGGHIAIAIDTRGPEYRTFIKKSISVREGDSLRFVFKADYEKKCLEEEQMPVVGMTLSSLSFLKKDNILLLDDIKLKLRVGKIECDTFFATALNNHVLKTRKRISFGCRDCNTPFLSEDDIRDLRFGVENGVDAVFLSFVESAEEVKKVRQLVDDSTIQIIAKIETHAGVENIEEIEIVSDGIMIARGDLCANVGIENLFPMQKTLNSRCKKPLIMATEMMFSMVGNAVPTRSEISDVGNAVYAGCHAVMLSSETAVGKYPIICTDTVRRICLGTEAYLAEKDKTTACKHSDELDAHASMVKEDDAGDFSVQMLRNLNAKINAADSQAAKSLFEKIEHANKKSEHKITITSDNGRHIIHCKDPKIVRPFIFEKGVEINIDEQEALG